MFLLLLLIILNLSLIISSWHLNQIELIQQYGATFDSLYLDLSEQNIHSIDLNTFRGFSQLKYIYLQENKLKKLDFELFKDLVSLRELWLESNEIIEIIDLNYFYTNLTYLKIVCLNNNPIINNQTLINLNKCHVNEKKRDEPPSSSLIFDKIQFLGYSGDLHRQKEEGFWSAVGPYYKLFDLNWKKCALHTNIPCVVSVGITDINFLGKDEWIPINVKKIKNQIENQIIKHLQSQINIYAW